MPIRPENKERYPANWPEISKAIRERAGNKCEKCKVSNGAMVKRIKSEDWGPEPVYMTEDGNVRSAIDGQLLGMDYPAAYEANYVKIVLTVAHLDHTPENCDPANLRCWCQRCHNHYDAPMRRAGTASRKRSKAAVGDLFGGQA